MLLLLMVVVQWQAVAVYFSDALGCVWRRAGCRRVVSRPIFCGRLFIAFSRCRYILVLHLRQMVASVNCWFLNG